MELERIEADDGENVADNEQAAMQVKQYDGEVVPLPAISRKRQDQPGEWNDNASDVEKEEGAQGTMMDISENQLAVGKPRDDNGKEMVENENQVE